MTDSEAWQRGVELLSALHKRLSDANRREFEGLLDRYRLRKGEMLALTLEAGSSGICRECGGQCCLNGKYRMSGLDLLALLAGEAQPLVPDFALKPLCPYGDATGCRMEPALRPLDCVLFICDAIEGRLDETAAQRLAPLEGELRDIVSQAEALLGRTVGRPLLLLAGLPGE